jgi:hypothetical protein
MTQSTIELQSRLAARTELESRAKLLAQLGNGWHLAEFGIALGAGIAAGSVAVTSFAGDSLVEVLAASAIVWLFGAGRGGSEQAEPARATTHRRQLLPARRLHRLARPLRPQRRIASVRELGRHRAGRVHRADNATPRPRQTQGRPRAQLLGHRQRGRTEPDLRLSLDRAPRRATPQRRRRLVRLCPSRGSR